MTELVLHRERSDALAELAGSHVGDGSLSEPETPALLRRVARERLGVRIELRVVVVVAVPVCAPPQEDFALVEHEVRPGVRNWRLARVPRNDAWGVRLGALARAMRRARLLLGRRLREALSDPAPASTAPAPEAAYRFRGGREGRVALLPGPSRGSWCR